MDNIAADEKKIRVLTEERVEAVKSMNVDMAISHYSEDVILFDIVGPLHQTGKITVKARLEQWFATMKSLVDFEITQLKIEAGENIAFCHSFNHINAITKDDNKLDMWWRETTGWKKINGEWLITQAHSSVPFNPETGKPSLDLKP